LIVRWGLDGDDLEARRYNREAPAMANPRPAPPDTIRDLLEEIW
jgi:hypothetical protein